MNSEDFERKQAKSNLKQAFALVFVIILLCVYDEVKLAMTPLHQATVVYVGHNRGEVNNVEEQPTQEQEVSEPRVVEEGESLDKAVVLQEFLDYIHQIDVRTEAVVRDEDVLDKLLIENPENENQNVVEEKIFKENQIEIYDTDKGVVGVVRTENVEESQNQNNNEESHNEVLEQAPVETPEIQENEVKTEEQAPEKGETIEENLTVVEEEQTGTVDLMKGIINQ